MKHYLFIYILFFISATSSMAQELTVKEFKEVASDLSARTKPRQDNNGDACAIVKVQLAASNATFSGNVIGDVEFINNEYWVYMTAGSKRLKVIHPSYLPLEVSFADYDVSQLTGKTTYVLTILLGNLPQGVQQQKVQTRWMLMDSDPAGASVYINDEFVGNTPLDGYKQPYGTYSYRLEMPDYLPASGTLELNSCRMEKNIKLVPAFGAIAISCNIGGATVLLDGKAVGSKTPCILQKVASGQHTITLQKDKYAPRQENVTVEDGKTTTVNVNLDARFATITITSLEGAQIWSNGKQIGTTKCQEDMMEGFYDLEVKLPHHWDDCQTFITKLNELTGRNFRLPTEAEWEFAARGGNASEGYTYSGSNNVGDVAWYDSNSSFKTHDVATKAPNELGLYDMSGNVLEWCQDWYGSYSSEAQTNPTGPASGSYRVAIRYVLTPSAGNYCGGFRLAQ